jgi:hypothetical protein
MMASHRKEHVSLFAALTKRQWTRLVAGSLSVVMLICVGLFSRDFYGETQKASAGQVTEYSATQTQGLTVSRDTVRKALDQGQGDGTSNTSYIKVQVNGKSKIVLGDNFTTVKSVLEAGDITLNPDDTVTPALDTPVNESTVITISSSDSKIETSESEIAFNTIEEQTDSLPSGTKKVQSEGQAGVMVTTSLVTVAGGKNTSSNVFASYVKTAPVNKVVLVGTGKVATSTSGSSSSSTSTQASTATASTSTAPVGDSQSIAHQMVLSRGWSESDFTCLVQLWNRESGWRTNAANPSGAYGIPQALPGSKMASAGADWATNPATQISWGLGYIAGRYSTPCGAWAHSQSSGWY